MNEYKHNNVSYERYSDSLLPSVIKTVCALLNTCGGSISFIEDSENTSIVLDALYMKLMKNILLKDKNNNLLSNYKDF